MPKEEGEGLKKYLNQDKEICMTNLFLDNRPTVDFSYDIRLFLYDSCQTHCLTLYDICLTMYDTCLTAFV